MNYLSTNIKYLQQKGFTQEELVKIVEKTRVLISQWKSEDRDITTEDIIKLSDYFNLPTGALVEKDLRLENKEYNELGVLFNKHKVILADDEREHIKFIIEKRNR